MYTFGLKMHLNFKFEKKQFILTFYFNVLVQSKIDLYLLAAKKWNFWRLSFLEEQMSYKYDKPFMIEEFKDCSLQYMFNG